MADPTIAQAYLDHSQRPSTREVLRPLAVEGLIREARAAGYIGPQRKLARLIRTYVGARESCAFATWLWYVDRTGDDAAWAVDRRGGAPDGT